MNRSITFLICTFLGFLTALAGGNYTMNVGEETLLSFTPASGAQTETMVWTISAPSCLEFVGSPHYKSYARVKAVKSFSSTIVVQCRYQRTIYNGNFPYSQTMAEDFYITINPSEPTGIYIPGSLSLVVGDRHTITPTIEPSGATTNVSWSTSDSGIAAVTSSGTVIANSPGTAYITARTDNGYSSQCRVTVFLPTVTLSASAPSGLYPKGKKVALKASPSDASIYYTLDGSTPSSSSTLYTDSIELNGKMVLKAVAICNGYENSNIVNCDYNTTSLFVIGTYPENKVSFSRPNTIPLVSFNENIFVGDNFDQISLTMNNQPIEGDVRIFKEMFFFMPVSEMTIGDICLNVPEGAFINSMHEPNMAFQLNFNLYNVSPVVKIEAGGYHSFAIKEDGTLLGWGKNDFGQLGDGTTTQRSIPVQIMNDVIAVSAGGNHSLAIKTDNTLWAWGANWSGQLGDSTTTQRSIPVQIMNDVIAVSAGENHSLAIKTDNTLWAWGKNDSGELGDGTNNLSNIPIKIMDDVRAISAGQSYTLVIKNDNSLWSWGNNTYNQLGDGTRSNRNIPLKILDDVMTTSAGIGFAVAIKNDNSLWLWGYNSKGQLGDMSLIRCHTPIKYSAWGDFTSVSAGRNHVIATNNTSLYAWGTNAEGQVGTGSSYTTQYFTPQYITGNVLAISAGYDHSLALKSDNSVWSWGQGGYGQLGNRRTYRCFSPTKIFDNNFIDLTSFELPETNITIGKGIPILTKLTPLDADYKHIEWSSEDESIATVDEYGIVTGVGIGQTTLNATITDFSGNTFSANCAIIVAAPLVGSITLNKTEAALKPADSVQLTATIAPENASDKAVVWCSSDTNIATVDDSGLVTAISVGETEIIATASDGSGVSATCKIIVEPIFVESLSISPESFTGVECESFILSVTILPDNATNKNISFSSSNEEVATIDNCRKVTIGEEGTAIIKATTVDGSNLSAECVVTSASSGIDQIFKGEADCCDVFNVSGYLLIKDAKFDDLHRLPDGIYMLRRGNEVIKLYLKAK